MKQIIEYYQIILVFAQVDILMMVSKIKNAKVAIIHANIVK